MWESGLLIMGVSYLSGSFPTAYLLVKAVRGIDIRQAGSGNVGALNTIRTVQSWKYGLLVLLIDALKGAVPVWLVWRFFPGRPELLGLAALAAVVGHAFPLWLRFRGGRGLATAAGGLVVAAPVLVIFWMGVWGLAYAILRKVILASMIGFGALLPFLWFLHKGGRLPAEMIPFLVILDLLLMVRHLPRLMDYLKQKNVQWMT
jgi:glycerol-3-phosphate acyltransferase PlsY